MSPCDIHHLRDPIPQRRNLETIPALPSGPTHIELRHHSGACSSPGAPNRAPTAALAAAHAAICAASSSPPGRPARKPNTIRYPDALVTCAKLAGTDRTVPGVVAVFEIVSPPSGRIDRIVKLREYAAVASIKRYVIIESATSGVLVLHRQAGDHPWTAVALTPEDMLDLPEIGLQIPVAEFYENVDFAESQPTNINAN